MAGPREVTPCETANFDAMMIAMSKTLAPLIVAAYPWGRHRRIADFGGARLVSGYLDLDIDSHSIRVVLTYSALPPPRCQFPSGETLKAVLRSDGGRAIKTAFVVDLPQVGFGSRSLYI